MQIDFSNLQDHFEDVAYRMGPDKVSDLLERTAYLMREAWFRRFDTKTNADGSPWSSDLVETGELEASCEVVVGDDYIAAGPGGARNIDIARYQSEKGNTVGGVDDILAQAVLQMLDQWVADAFEG